MLLGLETSAPLRSSVIFDPKGAEDAFWVLPSGSPREEAGAAQRAWEAASAAQQHPRRRPRLPAGQVRRAGAGPAAGIGWRARRPPRTPAPRRGGERSRQLAAASSAVPPSARRPMHQRRPAEPGGRGREISGGFSEEK
ncbi:hypothetical protein P7K49_029223 [Saguinus oedipus]|uniref:Uncharacterized protein n=1 Tax=Saguinus oedipus TaxID=9490 RepID=A0ABQ9U7E7_SAGOE|nr:hypothetical protein P7K49_029223 [Saguinus oedipus]